jgi:hypothetical protein
MSTILVINAVSSLLAGAAIGGRFAWRERQIRRKTIVQPVSVTTRVARRQPHR